VGKAFSRYLSISGRWEGLKTSIVENWGGLRGFSYLEWGAFKKRFEKVVGGEGKRSREAIVSSRLKQGLHKIPLNRGQK